MAAPDFIADAQATLAQVRVPPKAARPVSVAEARKVAQDFEAFFLGQMLQPMFAGIEVEEPFGGGGAERMWRSLQVDEYGKAIAKAGGVGIADAVMRQILKAQELVEA